MFNLTIDLLVQVIAIVLFAAWILMVWTGVNQVRSAERLQFYLLRRERMRRGWRVILLSSILVAAALLVQFRGREISYQFITPTPSTTPTATRTLTPTITQTATITLTPTITFTPTITTTPQDTATPMLPEEVTVLFNETVTPNPDAVFSPIQVARRLDGLNQAVSPSDTFENPVSILYGAFSYDYLADGVRWSAIWYLDSDIVCFETLPWDGGTGGYGFTECRPEVWLPGEYEIQIFLGETWKNSTRFTVIGQPPTPTPSVTSTPEVEISPAFTAEATSTPDG